MKKIFRRIFLCLLVLGFTHCKEKVKPEVEEVKQGLLQPLKNIEKPKTPEKPDPNTDPNKDKPKPDEKKPDPDAGKEDPAVVTDPETKTILTIGANTLRNNISIKEAFEAYSKSGIDDAGFNLDGLIEKLSAENLGEPEQAALITQFFKIIEYRSTDDQMDKFLESYPIVQRMKAVFNLYFENALFQKKIVERIKLDESDKIKIDQLTDAEQKIAIPFWYNRNLSNNYYIQPTENAGFGVYESIDSKDGKKYRTMVVGRVDFSTKGKITDKTQLPEADIKNLAVTNDFLEAWLNSNAKPTESAETYKIKIVGHSDAPPSKANQSISEKRAKLIYDYVVKNTFPGTFVAEGWADYYPWISSDPKDDKNRRVEIVIYHELAVDPVAPAKPDDDLNEPTEQEEDSD